jgi:hypothetical protein
MSASPNPVLPPEPGPLTEEQKNLVLMPSEDWSDQRAGSIAMGDFNRAMTYRLQNHDRRFKIDYQLYTGWRRKNTWEGTRIPRASIPVFLVNEQIESTLPSWIDALLGDPDFFSAMPLAGTLPEQARAVTMLLKNQLRDLSENNIFESFREIVRQVKKSDLMHGNGLMEWGWSVENVNRLTLERQVIPGREIAQGPDGPILVSNGQTFEHVVKTLDKRTIRKPNAKFTQIEDFYIDPNCPSTNVQKAGYCSTRHLFSIEKIKQMMGGERAQEFGFKLPDDGMLIELAKAKFATEGDNDKLFEEVYRGNSYNPVIDQSVDPGLARIELIRYFRPNRIVWMLGRKWVAYNQPNEYGLLPFLNCSGIDLPGRFYGISYSDLLEGDQKLIATILEARIDELNLMIHPPILRKLGSLTRNNAMRRLRPGAEWEVDAEDPGKAIQRMEMGNVTQQAFLEVDAAERRSQKTTGITDLVALGTPGGQGNSANRTATGIRTQQAATAGRIKYQVVNFEDQFLQPFLYILHGMNKKFLDPNGRLQLLGPDANQFELDPLAVINADVHFQMLGSSKMKTRDAMQSGGAEVLIQGILNPQIVQIAMQQGFKPNMMEITQLFTDALGMPAKSLFTQMSQQEMQALKQPSPDQILRAQMQSQREAGQAQLQEDKFDNDVLIEIIKLLLQHKEVPIALLTSLGLDDPQKLLEADMKAKAAKPKVQ